MKKVFLVLAVVALSFLVIRAFAGEPGSVSDPLVTKSFLEKTYGWEVTVLEAGEKLPLDLGSEVVLRSGKAVVSGTASGGLSDLTAGEDLPDDILIPANHYLLSPASDGRGIKAITTSVFLTRGLVR